MNRMTVCTLKNAVYGGALLQCGAYFLMAKCTIASIHTIKVIDLLWEVCRMAGHAFGICQRLTVWRMTVGACLDLSMGLVTVTTFQISMPARMIRELLNLQGMTEGT